MTPPRIYRTAEWGARPIATVFPQQAAAGIVIHNTESPNRAPMAGQAELNSAFSLARQIQASHIDARHWSDTGQHFTVSRGGVLMEGRTGSLAAAQRGQVVKGAHAGVDLYNRTWWGIEIEGDNVQAYAVTPAQWAAVIELCAWLCKWGQIDTANIKGHSQVKGNVAGGTDCPGHILDHLDDLRAVVHARKLQIISS